MSITSVSAASSVAVLQQSLTASATNQPAGANQNPVQSAAAGQANAAPEQGAKTHHHHHHRGGGGEQASELIQSGTADAAGTNILNTLV